MDYTNSSRSAEEHNEVASENLASILITSQDSIPSDLEFAATIGENQEIMVETNYDIIACYVEDDFGLQVLFDESVPPIIEQARTRSSPELMETQHPHGTSLEDFSTAMNNLIAELDMKLSGKTSTLSCFPVNPRISENPQYVVFHDTEEEEDRTTNTSWCTCTNCVKMPTNIESICCQEIKNIDPYLESFTCIIQHDLFNIYCKRPDTTTINVRLAGQFMRPPPQKIFHR
ncbi:uncharacterized protein [Engystomops pustulosus]|uniref:uncharacterized protein n=1 Tax=Engystomops pustulosus TaxID=76066 RepID=UPI003AFB81DE